METSIETLNCQYKIKDMQLTKSKTKLNKKHKQRLKVQIDLKVVIS